MLTQKPRPTGRTGDECPCHCTLPSNKAWLRLVFGPPSLVGVSKEKGQLQGFF